MAHVRALEFVVCVSLSTLLPGQDWKAQPAPRVTGSMDLSDLSGTGARVLEGFSGKADGSRWGVLKTYEVRLPRFTKALFFAHATKAKAWPNMRNQAYPYIITNNKNSIANLRDGVVFFILPLDDGSFLAVTTLPGNKTQSWFHSDKDGRFLLSFGTFGTEGVDRCDVPLFAWARSDDVYEACQQTILSALSSKSLKGWAQTRHRKGYEEYFRHLGWCSWEHFKGNINEGNLLESFEKIESSGIPVRYAIVDMGHTAQKGGGMTSFKPHPDKFPNEWPPLLKRRKDGKIKWMCLWHFFEGGTNGVHPENDLGPEINRHLIPYNRNILTPRNNPDSALAFYRAYMSSVKEYGFDFLKIDFQSAQLQHLAGKVEHGLEMCRHSAQALETALRELDLGLINCNWHNPVNFFNCIRSNVGRCSMDYVKHNLFSARRHLWQSYANTLWMAQLVWPDHDMFHSSDSVAGRTMAISKAVSGGPVYLSDAPDDFNPEVIRPLCFSDGRLLRPLAPGAPLPDSIFVDPFKTEVPYRVIAPLPNDCAAVVAYNLRHKGDAGVTLTSKVSPGDYVHASAMIQPYPGKWKMPAEGLVLYDWHSGKGWKMEKDYTFELKGLADRLVLLCPIRRGWAVIGSGDKYLSPAGVEILSCEDKTLKIRMHESGPLMVWSGKGKPSAEGLQFIHEGDGLYKAVPPAGKAGYLITLVR